MGKSKKQFNPDEPVIEEVPVGQQEVPPAALPGHVPLFAMENILTIEKELSQLRSDMNKAEHFHKRDLDRQNLDRQKEMEEVRAMFRQIALNQTQGVERATQGPNKGKGLMGGPGYQTDTEIDPNNASDVGTSQAGAKLMGPPPTKNQVEPTSEFLITPREPRYSHLHFGDSTFIDYDEDLKNLTQTTTVPVYQRQFERLASMVQWPEKALIGAFKGGLRRDIKREMKIHRFEALEECFAMARIYEERIEERKEEKREKREKKG
ncbi:hypothetical protein EJ110_NYTH46127 [Nymphaea thermarum]|nr:hypothetical protein EJ110_NYTH46127 [Nymphaea thermarum]